MKRLFCIKAVNPYSETEIELRQYEIEHRKILADAATNMVLATMEIEGEPVTNRAFSILPEEIPEHFLTTRP
jgi:hypothetical protein